MGKYKLITVILIIFLTIATQYSKVYSLTNTENEAIIKFLKEADKVKWQITFTEMEGIIGYQDGVELAPIKGKFTSLAAIMSILGDYFTEEAAKIEISKLGLFEIGGKIGAIRADGEAVYCIDDNSKFEFIIDKNEEKFIEITMFSEYDETNWFYYYLKNIRGKWKIVDQVSANTIKDENTYIAIRSSSFLYTDNDSYFCYNVWDRDIKTTWAEGKSDDGLGEWIDLAFFPAKSIEGVKIINGFSKSSSLYQNNNRVKKVKIVFSDGTYYIGELQDEKMGFQIIQFPKPRIVERMKIVILEIYPGKKYRDTCVSEISVVETKK